MNGIANKRIAALWLFGVVAILPTAAQVAPTFAVRAKALQSLVQITAKDCSDGTERAGSGFALEQPGRIVTAHHVVGGCRVVLVRYEGVTGGVPASKTATVSRVLPKGDLALLSVSDPPSVPVLKRAPPPPDRANDYAGFGYQNGQFSGSDLKVTFATGQSRLESILTPQIVSELKSLQSPIDTQLIVLRFNMALQPGMSGGPIVDANGAVIGVVGGGLKAGAAPASWGWPAEWIGDLLSSPSPINQSIKTAGAYYTLSELAAVNRERSKARKMLCGRLELLYLGTRSFGEVVRGTDDYPRVQHLMRISTLNIEELNSLAFDIWVHEPSGATAVTPTGYKLSTDSATCVAKSPDGLFQQVVWGSPALPSEIQAVSTEFEWIVMRPRVPNFDFSFDPQLTTVTPMGMPGPQFRENGMVFNRKGFTHAKVPFHGPTTPIAHSFETLIAKAGTFLGVGTVNGEISAQLPGCLQLGMQQDACAATRRHVKIWTHFILATQLSTYPAY
jgi:hypothetical protein